MLKRRAILNCIAAACVLAGLWGCDQAPDPPPQARIVRQKIKMPKDRGPQPTVPPKAAPAATKPAPKPAVKPAPPKPAPVQTVAAAAAKPDTKAVAAPKTYAVYNPSGKIDPFMSPFDTPVARRTSPTQAKTPKKPQRPLTPLEKVDMSRFRLTGTIRGPRGNQAMIEDAAGKGYVITKGTYIGINAGIVVGIQKDRIIVEEEVENVYGETSTRRRELRIKKPLGEK